MTRRFFLKGLAGAIGLGAGTYGYGALVERHRVDVRTMRLDLGLGKPLRMAALGDIHFDPLHESEYLIRVAELVSNLSVDLVVYTGDLFSHDSSRADELASILAIPKPAMGSFAVLGNHDFWAKAASVQRALEAKGIQVLRNRTVGIPGFDAVYLTGLESYWAGKPDPSVVSKTQVGSRHILAVHEPDPFAALNDPRVKLQVSGHTHGGQVRVPWFGALCLPSWGRRYQAGLYQKDSRWLHVNRGIGTLSPHVRFNCRPEIALFELC